MSPPWLLPAGIVLLYAVLITVWRWLLRRWGLSGSRAPPRSSLGESEYLARRSLRALLSFDLLVIIPLGLPASAALLYTAVTNPREFRPEMITGVLGVLAFVLLVPALRRSIRRMEHQRLAGQEVQPRTRPNTSGLAELDEHLRAKAWGTLTVAGLVVFGSVAAWLVPDHRLAALLLKDNDAILAGQVWRLLTVALVHGGVLHLLFNVSVYVSAGSLLERLAGVRSQLLVFVMGTMVGSTLSVAFFPRPSVGASGGVLAVATAIVAFGIRHRSLFPSTARTRLFRATVQLVALNVLLTFVLPNVDWAGHVGGFLSGAVLGWFAAPAQATLNSLAASTTSQLGPHPQPTHPASG